MAIAFDSESHGVIDDDVLTFSHTCSGTDRLLVVGVAIDADDEYVESITYNGVNLTKAKRQAADMFVSTELWYLKNPASGTHDVVVTISFGELMIASAVSLTGVDQTSPLSATAGAKGEGNPITVDTTTAVNDEWVIDGVAVKYTSTTPAVGSGQTLRWQVLSGNLYGMGSTEPKASPGSVTMNWTNIESGADWATVAASFKPAITKKAIGYVI